MPKYVFDTNHLTFYEQGHGRVMARYKLCHPDDVVTTIVCIQEVLKGRMAAISTARKPAQVILALRMLQESVELSLPTFKILPYDLAAEAAFQSVRVLRPRIGTQDQRIAAIALSSGLTLVTSNTSDFVGIPGLQLADWSI